MLDKTTYLLKARISFGRTALQRKLTFPRVFSIFRNPLEKQIPGKVVSSPW